MLELSVRARLYSKRIQMGSAQYLYRLIAVPPKSPFAQSNTHRRRAARGQCGVG
jgi:hypothetical protein